MEALVLGCGEAFDNDLFNTSILLRTGAATFLLDCGYSIPARLWQAAPDPNEVDLIYISHPHADHYFGLPAVLGRMWEDGRTKKLTILTQPPVIEQIRVAMELGYRTLSSRFQFEIEWLPAALDNRVAAHNTIFRFAETKHSVTNYAVRIENAGQSVCLSGDGMWTAASRELFRGADLVFHEAYLFDPSPVHTDIPSLLSFAAEEQIRHLALVHVQRALRVQPSQLLSAIADAKNVQATLPAPGAKLAL